jgi:hypothetical protein
MGLGRCGKESRGQILIYKIVYYIIYIRSFRIELKIFSTLGFFARLAAVTSWRRYNKTISFYRTSLADGFYFINCPFWHSMPRECCAVAYFVGD